MPDALITAQGLAERLASTTVLDVRWTLAGPSGRVDYLAGHIPGAAFVDLDEDLAAPPGPGGRHPLPDAATFGAAMRRAGVSAARPVVVYAGTAPGSAARAWWILRFFGHTDVRVLDGGIDAWAAAGGALETGEPAERAPGDFTPRPGGMPTLDAAAAADLATSGALLDVRTPERFRGEQEPIDPVAGHIPGARNLPVNRLVGAGGVLPHAGALQDELHALGADQATEVGAYCGSGVAAAHLVLALAHAGRPASLYVGSWSDWITDPDRPVARGT
jgi:thiosulfate/3-mercaptopyruvate sulfurtransferase